MSRLVKIGVLGASGRMGQMVRRVASEEFASRVQLVATPKHSESLSSLNTCDVVIDFSSPDAVIELIRNWTDVSPLPALVVGSTGWKLEQRKELDALAARTPVLAASNFSIGVLALLYVLKQAAPVLEKLGYAPSIVETHHRHKKDAPSGTAISLQCAISPSGPGNVQTHAVRTGEVIGDHEVSFHGPGDHLTFGHFAHDRAIFARGAIEAALWLATKRSSASSQILSMDQFFREKYQ